MKLQTKCFVFQLCQNESKRAASSALIWLQVLGLVTTLLFCALTFALKVWNFFFPSQSSIPVQVIIWGKLSTSFPIAIFAILLLNQKHQYCSMYFRPILIAFTDKLQGQALSIWLPREVTVWLARSWVFHRENSAWDTVSAYFSSEICTWTPRQKIKTKPHAMLSSKHTRSVTVYFFFNFS